MSISIMNACWDLPIPATQKIVLISLADQANDSGVCWPSLTTLMRRTGLKERAIQNAFRWLEERGVLAVSRATGKSNLFTVSPSGFADDPRTKCTPAPNAPPHQMHHGPAPDAGDPRTRCALTIKNQQRTQRLSKAQTTVTAADMQAEGVNAQHAADFLAVRKAKRAPLTATAWSDLKTQAAKAGISTAKAVHICAIKGWQGFNASWNWQSIDQPSKQSDTTAEAARLLGFLDESGLLDEGVIDA